jgi:hypothetical protein
VEYLLIPQSRVLGKVMVTQLVKKFPAFYETQWFTIMFTRAHYWTLPSANGIKFTLSGPIYVTAILILSSYLCQGIPSSIFSSDFLTKILIFILLLHHLSYVQYFPQHPILRYRMCNNWVFFLLSDKPQFTLIYN